MEDTLRAANYEKTVVELRVLILVLMEDTLRVGYRDCTTITVGLNPCFNGRYSQSRLFYSKPWDMGVLILVLMEDTLRANNI